MTTAKKSMSDNQARAVGRRKTAAARVRLMPGKGLITINGRELSNYFPLAVSQEKVRSPLVITSRDTELDVTVKVAGGGVSSQADAVRHGVARALVKWNEDLRALLRAEGFLTRDPRAKERKKPGLHKARRAHQWRKR